MWLQQEAVFEMGRNLHFRINYKQQNLVSQIGKNGFIQVLATNKVNANEVFQNNNELVEN